MRTRLITCSLLLNGLLLAVLVAPGSFRVVSNWVRPSGSAVAPVGHGGSVSVSLARDEAAEIVTWATLVSDDPRELIERLRATGMPPTLIRSIVGAKLDREIAPWREAFRAAHPPAPYWNELARANPRIDFKAAADLRQAERRNAALLDAALGPETALAEHNDPIVRMKYGDLPEQKAQQARLIEQDYDELIARVTEGMIGITLPEDGNRLALLQAEKERDLRSVLSAEEYETLLLRGSPTATAMRSALFSFAPTEEEFRAIFRLRRKHDEKYPTGIASFAEAAARRRDQDQLLEQIKAVLGPERGTLYEIETHPGLRFLHERVSSLGVSKEAVVQAGRVHKEIGDRFAATNSDPSLSIGDRRVRNGVLQAEFNDRIRQILGGQRGLDILNQSLGALNIFPLPLPSGL